MKIKELVLKGFHNLKDIHCLFSDSKVVGFIGDNGSGKSSVLEGINDAFYMAKHIDTVDPSYIFDISYEIGENLYRFENTRSTYFEYKNSKIVRKNVGLTMPQAIFTYYAGETERLNRFANAYKEESKRYITSIKNESIIKDFKFSTSFSLRDFKIAFLVNYLFDTPCFHNIKEKYLRFDQVKPNIILQLKKPSWASATSKKEELWNAKGFQKTFYDKLLENDAEYGSGAFVRLDESNKDYKDEIWLGLLHADLFKKLAKTPLELFIQLKALFEVDLLENIFISVKKRESEESFDVDYFSEGEKQLANLLMILTMTKNYEAIYLLDEFDAYLHPNWQRNFVKMVSDINIQGQIFFTTHSPATISGIRKENVFKMENGQASKISTETYNRALDEIMEEHMYVSMRPKEFTDLEIKFRNAVINGDKELAERTLDEIRKIVGSEDPFFITATMAMRRMK